MTTTSPVAQRWFDQGLRYVYAFNHQEAVRSFRHAATLDRRMAMAHWGIALALGPNYNAAEMSASQRIEAQTALRRAQALAGNAPAAERGYIEALALRLRDPFDADPLQSYIEYRDAMRALMRAFPDDPDAATLCAEAGMLLRPWRLWNADGTPAEGTDEVVMTLETVIARHPRHTGAHHFLIHAVEASPQPERALTSAQSLPALAPAAGHLVHMAAHIFDRVGDHPASARANASAIAADRAYIGREGRGSPYLGYYAHNLHFLAVAHMQQGRYRDATRAARAFGRYVASTMPDVPGVEGFLPAPAMIHTRFQRWDAVLALRQPPATFAGPRAIWHFARGMAFVARGDLAQAKSERNALDAAARSVSSGEAWGRNRAEAVVALAASLLDGNLAWAAGERDAAIRIFDAGAVAEDALAYDEPAPWLLPLREALGAALLAAGDPGAAEGVFRADLLRHPNSGRALHGLAVSLEAQRKAHDDVDRQLARAWRNADSPPRLGLVPARGPSRAGRATGHASADMTHLL